MSARPLSIDKSLPKSVQVLIAIVSVVIGILVFLLLSSLKNEPTKYIVPAPALCGVFLVSDPQNSLIEVTGELGSTINVGFFQGDDFVSTYFVDGVVNLPRVERFVVWRGNAITFTNAEHFLRDPSQMQGNCELYPTTQQ